MPEDTTRVVARSASSAGPDAARRGAAGTIRFQCPNGHQIVVPDKLAGKRGACSRCGAAVVIPAEPSADAKEPAAARPSPEEPAAPVEATAAVETAQASVAAEHRAEEGGEFPGLRAEASPEPGGPAAEAGIFDGIEAIGVDPGSQSFAGVEASGEPEIDGIDNPTAVLMLKLFSEASDESAVELHLKSGQIVMPLLFDFRWSRGTHGVFATRNQADGSVNLLAVAWDSVEQVIVRKVPGLPEGMFE